MASLAITYDDLVQEVGGFVGFGRKESIAEYATTEQNIINSIIKSGLRKFYYPERMPGEAHVHEWNFLKPRKSITVAAGDLATDLDADVGGIDGDLTFSDDSLRVTVSVVGEYQIRKWRSEDADRRGQPQYAAVVNKAHTGAAEQRYELQLFPVPDAQYTLTYAANLRPDALLTTAKYLYGGAEHAETIIAACLAVAENRLDDARGVKWQEYIERLATSIEFDRQANTPDTVGYNGDQSDLRGLGGVKIPTVSYNGVEYDGAP